MYPRLSSNLLYSQEWPRTSDPPACTPWCGVTGYAQKHLVYVTVETGPRALCMPGTHSIKLYPYPLYHSSRHTFCTSLHMSIPSPASLIPRLPSQDEGGTCPAGLSRCHSHMQEGWLAVFLRHCSYMSIACAILVLGYQGYLPYFPLF